MIRSQPVSSLLSPTLGSARLLLLAAGAGLAACSVDDSDSESTFAVNRTTVSTYGTTPVAIFGKNLAFLGDESTTGAGGTDMNGDTDLIDKIAVAVDMATRVQTNLGVAAVNLAWIDNELYLEVDEALDGRDWEVPADPANKIVLLHWSAAAPTLVFVDRLAAAGTVKMLPIGSNLFYSSARVPTLAMDSNLLVIQSSAPLVPIPIATQDAVGPLRPRLVAKDESLIFLTLDETVETRDLNADTDLLDTAVLALLDGTATTLAIRSTELAIPATGSPLRAKRTSASSQDWHVGFLVSEAGQGATNLNAPALFAPTWVPPQCTVPDADTADDVLHYLEFAAWDVDPILDPPVNTGLVGSRKIAMANGYVATITPENDAADAGGEGTCDLNGDTDRLDHIVRWVQMSPPTVLPLTPAANLHALAQTPGGSEGLAELDNRFVIVVSEADDDLDLDGDSQKIFDLAGWLSPSGTANSNTPWDFTHGDTNSTFVGASWLAEQPDRTRLGFALEERVEGLNINSHVPPVAGEDLDTVDSVPTFPDLAGSPVRLAFPGVAIAVQPNNAGIVIARSYAFYRVEEADDSRNWNAPDADETDFILFRTSLTQATSNSMGVLNALPGRPAIEVNLLEATPYGGAFLADEQSQGPAGTDLNGDLDTTDLVLSYFRF